MSEAVKILAIEDSRLDAELLKAILTTGPYKVSIISDGKIALDVIKHQSPPHIIICDINLPHVDGISLIKYIKKSTAWKNLPIIAISGKMDYKTVNKVISSGATSVLTKPYDPERLLAEVLKLTGYERVSQ